MSSASFVPWGSISKTKGIHVENYRSSKSRDVTQQENSPLQERPTMSHRPCNVVVFIGDYLPLTGDSSSPAGCIQNHFATILD